MHEAFNKARLTITPEQGASESFTAYYAKKNWAQRWSDFGAKYGGGEGVQGEYAKIRQQFSASWAGIRFGKGFLARQKYWIPDENAYASVLPWSSAYRGGWESFKRSMVNIATSDFLRPQAVQWHSNFFDKVRVCVSSGFTWQLIPFVGNYSRPRLEDYIASPKPAGGAYDDTCVFGLMNASRTAGRFILKYLVSPFAWLARAVVSFVCDFCITLANILYVDAVALGWAATWLGQAGLLVLNVLWQASKFIAFPVSKVVGWLACIVAYPIVGTLYGVVAATAWLVKAVVQFIRFRLQNGAILLWNCLGRPFAWVLAHCVVGLKAVAHYALTAVKQFIEGAYTAGANFCSYIGGHAYYYLIRPAAEWSAKAFLAFVQVVSHILLGVAQTGYGIAKLGWHFAVKPALNFVSWCAKGAWNKLMLPVSYAIAVAGIFLVSRVLLFVAAVVQIVVYPLVLAVGGLGVGVAFVASEAELWLESQWISKAIYPLPWAAYLRGYEASPNFGIARQSDGYSPVP